ncbi:ornithine decarboxylase 1-like isoform X2 [Polyodon spathula]|uniref:ornithine decarboxylase 1-like isoform X2 n=1 Tax=Polyodon spathula TaxID=7913 RepID=UPI001B7F324A|nr:ornithine decarboxylase 1-like isoform X2 [Polyodon spathula]
MEALDRTSAKPSAAELMEIFQSQVTLMQDKTTALVLMHSQLEQASLSGDEDAFFVADLGDIVKKHLRWTTALPRVHPFYAVKCNPMEAVVQTLARLGAGFDCASEVELELVRGMGVLPERIIYANPCKQTSHIKKAASLGICAMTFDNEEELIKVARAHPNAKMVLRIATEDSGSMFPMSIKFGASLEECGHLLKVARELGVEVIGVSFHVGSNSSDPHCFSESIANARGVFDLGADLGHEMALLDIGGGFPGTDDFIVTFEEFAKVINQSLELHFPAESGVRIIAEPGRYYVASAFTLAANIIGKKFLPCNKETFNDEECAKSVKYYINDGRFGSFEMICHSHFTEMAVPYKQSAGQPLYSSSIWGPTCAAEDVILRQTQLPELQVGDWLIFENMGAYTVSLGTHFNGFSVPRVHFCISSKICCCVLEKKMSAVLL